MVSNWYKSDDDNMCKDSVSEEDQDAIEEMMEKIEDNTCLRFRLLTLMIIRMTKLNMLLRLRMIVLMILPHQGNRKEAAENPGDQNR